MEAKYITRKTTMYVRNVPTDTKAQFKAYCARRGYTMEAAVVALFKKAVLEDMPLRQARETMNNKAKTTL